MGIWDPTNIIIEDTPYFIVLNVPIFQPRQNIVFMLGLISHHNINFILASFPMLNPRETIGNETVSKDSWLIKDKGFLIISYPF